MGKKSGSSAGKKAAKTQAAADERIATAGTYADRADQNNPWSNLSWGQEQVLDPGTGKMVTKWTQNQTLSDDMQGLYDTDMAERKAGGDFKQGLLNRAYGEMGGAPDWAQFGDAEGMEFSPEEMRQRSEDMAYQRDAMRLDPRFEQEQAAMEVKLANQGLTPGDRAYDSAMASFNNSKNDAYERARLGAASAGRDEVTGMWDRAVTGNQMSNALRNQNIEEYIAKRGYSLGEAERVGAGNTYADAMQSVGGAA